MAQTKIEWATHVWNPTSGCTPVSEGCKNCYAKRMAYRLRGRCGYPVDDPFRVTLHPDRLDEPLRWKKPRRIFVNSMGDLFHENVPDLAIVRAFAIMADASHHKFLVLTKRPDRMKKILGHKTIAADVWVQTSRGVDCSHLTWPLPNLWLGVTCENQQTADERIPILLQIPAAVHFISVEPMLGPINVFPYLEPKNIREQHKDGSISLKLRPSVKWVIAGGEAGPNARPMHPDWVRSLRDQCKATTVPFFFKSWGEYIPSYEAGERSSERCQYNRAIGECWVKSTRFPDGQAMVRVGKKAAGRLLDGWMWDEVPE